MLKKKMKSNEEEDENEKLMPPRIPRKSSRYGLDVIEESDVVEEGTLFFFYAAPRFNDDLFFKYNEQVRFYPLMRRICNWQWRQEEY